MAFTINHITLVGGNLTRDAELRYASNGNARVSFSVAMNRSYRDPNGQTKDIVEFFDVVYWGKLAETVAPRLKKGQKVAIEGKLSQRRYTTQDGQQRNIVEVSASSVILIGGFGSRPENAGTHDASGGSGGYARAAHDSRPSYPSGGHVPAAQDWQGDQGGYPSDAEGPQFFDDSPMEENDVPF
jgi:single-strand DNA-binding protein